MPLLSSNAFQMSHEGSPHHPAPLLHQLAPDASQQSVKNYIRDSYSSPHLTSNGKPAPSAPRRSVRQLSEEALAKKRANDREAQRNIREKNRQKIEGLENRVRELESGEAFKHLQSVIQEREALRAENRELKDRMGSILSLISPFTNPLSQSAQSTTTAQTPLSANPPLPGTPSASSATNGSTLPGSAPWAVQYNRTEQPPHAAPGGDTGNGATWHPPYAANSPWSAATSAPSPSSGPNRAHVHSPATAPSPGVERLPPRSEWLASIRDNTSVGSSPASHVTGPSWVAASAGNPAKRRRTSDAPTSPSTYAPHAYAASSPALPYYSRLPNNNIPSEHQSSWCRSILPFIQQKRRLIESGASVAEVLGPPDPDYTDVDHVYNNPTDPDSEEEITLSHFVMQLIKAFRGLDKAPQQIPTMTTTFYQLRWYIHPSQETYDAMPDYMRPMQEQLEIPHAPWVDYIHFPRMRAKMVYLWQEIPLDQFFIPYSGTLSLNWPYGSLMSNVLCNAETSSEPGTGSPSTSKLTGEPRKKIRPAFNAHMRQIDNWSLGPVFAQTFPALADTHKVKHESKTEHQVHSRNETLP